ncbi:hypothetical protein PO587_27155 [Streptomyces gilvifuscus]|uniref:Transposase n=1 Tax=Streptomyces gilvifuscus TaxID=1550617 RepID=A0ABT5FZX7_9ACTN|nr:hypothetical protein [Streptomyces gilvifuscus]MDC2958131.1 hypothetical protein [Streptomyces gilvifuscus]
MNEHDTDERYEKSFQDWLGHLYDALDFPDPAAPPAWVRQMFEANSGLPADAFAQLAFGRRLKNIEEAFVRVAGTARARTGIEIPLDFEIEEPSDESPVGLASFAGSAIWAAEPPKVYVDAAEVVQTYLADRHRTAWPLCPDHRTGTHPKLVLGQAVWWCAAGAHESEAVC